ncbi:POU domain, class 4, transcription factor 2-like [Sycon ciliatum]|uniref:POU domain, class 4, transcription factor 2-like n=1 Tax=Sycon ciliatum TaxID=27933 RepID=UPI0031F637E4
MQTTASGVQEERKDGRSAGRRTDADDDALTQESLSEFAEQFKEKRLRLRYTQDEVGHMVGKVLGETFSRSSLQRFEDKRLKYKHMRKVYPKLKMWYDQTESVSPTANKRRGQKAETVIIHVPDHVLASAHDHSMVLGKHPSHTLQKEAHAVLFKAKEIRAAAGSGGEDVPGYHGHSAMQHEQQHDMHEERSIVKPECDAAVFNGELVVVTGAHAYPEYKGDALAEHACTLDGQYYSSDKHNDGLESGRNNISEEDSTDSATEPMVNREDASAEGDLPGLKTMSDFAAEFKKKRVELGFTQEDVGRELGLRYGSSFSQTTVCRFEALQLSHSNMRKNYPIMEKWLQNIINNTQPAPTSNAVTKKRRKRTSITGANLTQLEEYFSRNPKPTAYELTKYANAMSYDRDVVRVWFCNRRQKEKNSIK